MTATLSSKRTRGARPKPRPSRGADFVAWCAANVVHGAGDLYGQPFVLRPDQALFAFRWFELDETGRWWYERAYLEAPKGDGKTMLLAAIALFELLGPTAPQYPNIVVAANSQDQAMKEAGGIYKRIVDILEHPACPLGPFVDVGYDVIHRLDRPGQIRCAPALGKTADGGLPTLFIADEVQDWTHAAADAHERNENSTTKREDPPGRSLSASTPGRYAGDGSVGWRLHNYGLGIVKGTVSDDRFLFDCKSAPDEYRGRNDDRTYKLDDEVLRREAIRHANPGASDRRVERLVRRYNEIPYHRFCRFHLAWWVEEDGERWMDMEAYKRRIVTDRERIRPAGLDPLAPWHATLPAGTEVVAAFDGSVNDDATGLVVQTADGFVDVVAAWEKAEGVDHWTVPKAEVDLVVRAMFGHFTVRRFGADPTGWRTELEAWSDDFGDDVVLEVPPTNARIAPACEDFRADIVQTDGTGTVTVVDHPSLYDHIRNAIAKRTTNGTTIRKEHHESPRKIDLAVCAVMANDLRLRFLMKDPPKTPSRTMRTRGARSRRRRSPARSR